LYRLRIRYRSLTDVPARVQIWWEGKSFSREPLPAARLKHVVKEVPEAAAKEEQAARGRELVGRFGCGRCHGQAFPGVSDPPPGPSLAGLGHRVKRDWLMERLANPAKGHPGSRMPILFSDDRNGLIERWLVARYPIKATAAGQPPSEGQLGDHRAGKQAFLGMGCIACHHHPEKPEEKITDPERYPITGLQDRLMGRQLVAFLQDPAIRYPDGRMPKLPVTADTARNIAAYLLMW